MENEDLNINFEIGRILAKVVQKSPLTVEEHSILNHWLKKDVKNRAYFNNLNNEDSLSDSLKEYYSTDTNFQFKLIEGKIKKKRKIKVFRSVSIAAGIIMFLGAGVWLINLDKPDSDKIVSKMAQKDILPGSEKAILTLSSGKVIELDGGDGIRISSTGLFYNNKGVVDQAENVSSAVLKTPRGGQFQIILEDGTKVWLNANSSLEYPIKFTDKERKVRLTGEGFFEVHHDTKHPFIVSTQSQQVKVLGTTFNIRAYEDKQFTTLIKGSIQVKITGTDQSKKIKPNEQAIISQNGLTVQNVDASDYITWKDGLISSTSISLIDISKEIERWYNVDFVFPHNFKNTETAFISINKNEKLSTVLKVIEKTYGVKTEIQGKEVIIK